MLAAIILAAGESSRMGTPKALLPYRGRTFLQHLIGVTRHPRIGVTRVVLGANAEEVRLKINLDPETVVVNRQWKLGQLSSIQAALRSIPQAEIDGMLLALVDHPLISAALVGELVEKFYATGRPIVLPTFRGKRGHPVLFACKLFGELLAAPPDVGARAVVWAHAAEVLEVPTEEEGVILNLNDPETLDRVIRVT